MSYHSSAWEGGWWLEKNFVSLKSCLNAILISKYLTVLFSMMILNVLLCVQFSHGFFHNLWCIFLHHTFAPFWRRIATYYARIIPINVGISGSEIRGISLIFYQTVILVFFNCVWFSGILFHWKLLIWLVGFLYFAQWSRKLPCRSQMSDVSEILLMLNSERFVCVYWTWTMQNKRDYCIHDVDIEGKITQYLT